MMRLMAFVLVLLVAVGALGYWRGWFSLTTKGKVDVQVDAGKFDQDKVDFSKAVGEKATTMKDQLAGLWEKSEGLTGDEKTRAQEELAELEKKHERLEQQIKELQNASQDKFKSIKLDLSKNLEEVEKKIKELTEKLDKGTDE